MPPAGRCVLAPIVVLLAATVLNGAAGEPCDDCLKARYWTVPAFDERADRPPAFPESAVVASRPDLGIAFSGGGTRSAAATLGQLRALHRLGWLSSVRYVSAVSGGAWAAVPFTYSTLLPDDLLGRVEQEDPDRFTLDRVRKEPNGALAKAIAGSSLAAGGVREAAAFLANRPTRAEESALRQNIRLLADGCGADPSAATRPSPGCWASCSSIRSCSRPATRRAAGCSPGTPRPSQR